MEHIWPYIKWKILKPVKKHLWDSWRIPDSLKKYEEYRDWKDWVSAFWYAQHNARIIADFEYRMSRVLDASTSCMSKPYYTIEAMESEIADYLHQAYADGYSDAEEDLLQTDVSKKVTKAFEKGRKAGYDQGVLAKIVDRSIINE